jgi:hypothetical protein
MLQLILQISMAQVSLLDYAPYVEVTQANLGLSTGHVRRHYFGRHRNRQDSTQLVCGAITHVDVPIIQGKVRVPA